MRIKKGFTLVELIVVVIIVGILAAVAVPFFSGMKAKAITTEAVMGVSAMRQAVKNYSIGYTGSIIINLYGAGSYIPPAASASINPDDFNGTYFSKECYYGRKMFTTILTGKCNFDYNTFLDRAAEIDAMKDVPGSPAFISISKKGTITQSNFSRSGYPLWVSDAL